jgi:hypothetical protein
MNEFMLNMQSRKLHEWKWKIFFLKEYQLIENAS